MKVWFFIGRFQPAHKWHLQALLDMYATWVTHFIIGVWSAQKEWTEDNPFTFIERKKILELLLQEVPFTFEIHAIPDVWDDQKWFEYVTTKLPHFDVVLSWNPRLENIFRPKWYDLYVPTISVEIKWTNTRKAIALSDQEYIDNAINDDVYKYLLEINAPARLQKLMLSLQTYKVQYTCLLDNGRIISLGSSIPFVSAHEQIISYIKNEYNITVSICNKQPIRWEIKDPTNEYFIISLQFFGLIISK